MTPLFSEAGHVALRSFLMAPVLCLFDFDGTLVPLINNPALVSLPPAFQRQLQALQSLAPVGIISGRSLADMRQRLGFEPDYVIGNHGLEGLPGWELRAKINYELCRTWLASLRPMLLPLGKAVWIEDKSYSLTVHYRQAQDQVLVEQTLSDCFAKLHPAPRAIIGIFNVSLLPADAGDKGSAVEQLLLLSQKNRALYVGDDSTDEDVFSLHHPDLFTVHVGNDVSKAADYVIKDHEAIKALLDLLLALLPQSSGIQPIRRRARSQ
jgi:trehalose 6-phosphate phosphatase